MRILVLIVVGFVILCGCLIIESGLFQNRPQTGGACILLQQTTTNEKQDAASTPAPENERNEHKYLAPSSTGGSVSDLTATGGPVKSVMLGSVDPRSGFKFQCELSSIGAAIKKAAFSEFDDRDYKNPQPLQILSPVRQADGSEVLSMAIKQFVLVQQDRQFALDKLSWKSFDVQTTNDGSQSATFEAVIVDAGGQPILKINKTYKVTVNSYLLECKLTVENLSGIEQEVRFNLAGPVGIGREDIQSDMRKVIAGFIIDSEQQVVSSQLDVNKLKRPKIEYLKAYLTYLNPYRKWWAFWEPLADRKKNAERKMQETKGQISSMQLFRSRGDSAIWIATANKYFAAILRPVPDAGKNWPDWIAGDHVEYHDPDLDNVEGMSVEQIDKVLKDEPDGDETVLASLKVSSTALAPMGQNKSKRTYNLQLFIGPKNKDLFYKKELYRKLGFVHTITFRTCCCPASIIRPLAFAILATMKWMYGFIGNYGVVIIILVFLVRLAMYPISKKSQVSMSKMSKLAPMAEEIKKKYANNKAEMNKQMMALYRQHGASPIMGMLPMMAQMPIWIALYSAIYASIELRGAPFLPFWITDLSAPDALVRFETITVPLLGWKIASLNLLPILMGVAFYLQQKLMPSQAPASANPQIAQQQKMMMVMLPVLFPLMLYNGPSGLNLYIMASVFAGVVEQHVIRKHIREKEQEESKGLVAATSKTGGKVKKKKPKPFYKW